MTRVVSEMSSHEPWGCEVEVVVVTAALLHAFVRGELDEAETEAMSAFLDDHPEMRPDAEATTSPCTPGS